MYMTCMSMYANATHKKAHAPSPVQSVMAHAATKRQHRLRGAAWHGTALSTAIDRTGGRVTLIVTFSGGFPYLASTSNCIDSPALAPTGTCTWICSPFGAWTVIG